MPPRVLGWALIRSGLVTAVLIVGYALVPLGRRPDGRVVVELTLWLAAFFAAIGWQVVAVSRSPYPGLRAAESVAVSLPAFLLLFSATYYVIGQVQAGSFSETLSRLDAAYLTVTIFATVGFGDIVAKTEAARLAVTVQMLADLVLIGIFAKVLVGAVRRRRRDLEEEP